MIEAAVSELLDEGIDVSWFSNVSREKLCGFLGNLKAHRCRLDAVEANVILAINRVDRETAPRAKPSDAADDVKESTGDSGADANRKTKRASLFDQYPEVSKALAAGLITAGHADLLTNIPAKYQTQLEADLAELLAAAAEQTVDEFRLTLRAWRDSTAKANGEDPHRQRRDRRRCDIRTNPDGMTQLTALLDPEAGAIIGNTLTSIAQRFLREDQQHNDTADRNHRQRLADALTHLTANHGTSSPSGLREPAVVVGISLTDLQAGLDGHAYGTGPIPAETIRKLACEAGIIPAVLGTNNTVLNMGRRSRLANPAQRLALATQYDNQCAHPNCDRPFDWCHIHHLSHWENGGPTNLDNLIPLCTRHRHDRRLTITRTKSHDQWHRKPGVSKVNTGSGHPGRSA
ncbi:MAG: DUF222 domain-containing protein [Acidimicrobiales bacterium]